MIDPRTPASWLRDNWRPISALLLACTPLLQAFGLFPGMTEEAFGSLLNMTGIFLAIYAAGRTVEKVATSVTEARIAVASAADSAGLAVTEARAEVRVAVAEASAKVTAAEAATRVVVAEGAAGIAATLTETAEAVAARVTAALPAALRP